MLRTHRRKQEAECLYRRFVKLAAENGLPPIRLHDLRHGAASLALQAGVDLKVVSDQLGHSSIVLTAGTYISVLAALAMQAVEKTARLVARAGQYPPGSHHVTRRKANPPGHGGRQSAARPATTDTCAAGAGEAYGLAQDRRGGGRKGGGDLSQPAGTAEQRHVRGEGLGLVGSSHRVLSAFPSPPGSEKP